MNQHSLYILAGWVINGTGVPVRSNVLLELKGGYILSVTKASPDNLKACTPHDLSRCTIVPGLVDAHAHLFMSGTNDAQVRGKQLKSSYSEIKKVIKTHLIQQLNQGVVAVRDGGDYGGYTLRYKRENPFGNDLSIRINSPGKAWRAVGRYGRLIGRSPLKGLSLAQSILNNQEKVDHIKIVNSGLNSLTTFGKETPPQFTAGELKGAVKAGVRLGVKTMVHANGRLPVGLALDAGCHSIEHGFFMGEENLKKMAEKGITWVPTACTKKAYADAFGGGHEQERKEAEIARRNLDHQLEQIRTAMQYGVPMATGTDAGSLGVFHGKALVEEMKLFVTAGLSMERVVQCGSAKGAALMGMEKELGAIKPGRPATFLVVPGRPTDLLDNLGHPEKIFIKGEQVPIK